MSVAKRMAEPARGDPTVDFFEKVAQTLGEEGYGRLLAWQMMADEAPADAGPADAGPDAGAAE